MLSRKNIGLISTLIIGVYAVFSFVETNERTDLGANQFMVITVKGKIVFHKSGSALKRGDLYEKGVDLDFLTKTARAAVANKKTGRWVLTPNKKGQTTILPASNNLSSRSGSLLNTIDLKNFFEGRVAALGILKLPVSNKSFPQTKEEFFYLKYKYNKEVIAKKLPSIGDSIVFDRADIFRVDGKSIPEEEKEMTLYYKGAEKTYKISKFTPVFPDLQELKEELKMLGENTPSKNVDQRLVEAQGFIQDFYGKTDRENLKRWLTKEFE